MATNTFERKIELRDDESIRNLINVVIADSDRKNLDMQPFSDAERKRSEGLLNQSLLRSPFKEKVDLVKDLFGSIPANISWEEAQEERLSKI